MLAPFAPFFSHRVWLHAQLFLLGAMLAPGARMVTAALRVMGLARERHFTNYHRVLNRAAWSARQGSQMLLGLLITLLVPPGATIVLGADDTVKCRGGPKIKAKGCYRDAVRSTHKHVIRCFGLTWVSMTLLVPVPWAQRVWASPFLTVLHWPAEMSGLRRHKRSIVWVWQMTRQVRRWPPGGGLCQAPSGHGLAPALGCGPLSSVGTSALRQARPQTHQGEAPTQLAGLGRPRRYVLGDRGSGLVRASAQNMMGLLAHRPVVHPRVGPGRDSLGHGGCP